jgi:hypothetical protein
VSASGGAHRSYSETALTLEGFVPVRVITTLHIAAISAFEWQTLHINHGQF